MKKVLSLTLFIFIVSSSSFGQLGFSIPADSGKVELTLEESNDLIILPVTINNKVTLKFILGSSVEYSILSRKALGDELGLNYVRKIQLGSVDGNPNFAYSANGAQLSIGAAKTGDNHPMLVLENDFMNLSNIARTRVDGVIGYDLLGSFIVEVNRTRKKIVLHPKASFEVPNGYWEVPIEVVARKAYMPANIVFENWERETKKFQIKTGATHTVLFNSDSNIFHLPARKLEVPLGMGPTGQITGYVGRVREFKMGDAEFENVVASFTKNVIGKGNETGSIGAGILSRFDLIIDYSGNRMLIRRNKKYGSDFEYDLSGMRVDSDGGGNFFVAHVIPNSPAAKAGIKEGDRVLSIQGQALTENNLNELLKVFLEKKGRRVKMEIEKDGRATEVSFTLIRLI